MNHDFSHQSYREMLQSFLQQGYRVCGFEEANPVERHLIVRHDIDMSLSLAEPIAEIESELGISATYFVLMGSELYSPFTQASRRSISRIQSLGHDIGLHFDASCYENDSASLDGAVDAESQALELITGKPVRVISFHRPIPELQGSGPLAGRRHAYEPRYFSEMGYCSDSRGAWHYGHPLAHEAVQVGRALQLLTHPIWWTSQVMDGPLPKLENFLNDKARVLKSELAENCAPYRAVFKDEESGRSD